MRSVLIGKKIIIAQLSLKYVLRMSPMIWIQKKIMPYRCGYPNWDSFSLL